jgi:hypothetical protein
MIKNKVDGGIFPTSLSVSDMKKEVDGDIPLPPITFRDNQMGQ